MRNAPAPRILASALFVLCLACSSAGAAETPSSAEARQERVYGPETLNGLWRADVEGTRRLLGEERAAEQAKVPDVCLEFDLPAKCSRVWQDVSKKEQLGDFPFAVLGAEDNRIKVQFAGGAPTEIHILDEDTLDLNGIAIVSLVKAAAK